MDRKQLRALVAVADHRSFSGAARALDTVQSNVSAHVARLERDLGLTLIDRATTEPTHEGNVVLERARRIEAEFEALDSDIASLHDEISGQVRLGLIGTTARWMVPPLLTALGERHPGISVVLLDATTSSLVLNLVSGTVDLAVVNLPVEQAELVVEPLFDEDRVLIVPAGHPLEDRDVVEVGELVDQNLLLEAPGTAFRDLLDEVAGRSGTRIHPRAEFDGMRLLASMVFSGFGAGVVPASAAPPEVGGDWRTIPVDGVPGRRVGLARRRRSMPSAAQRAVAELIAELVGDERVRPGGIHEPSS